MTETRSIVVVLPNGYEHFCEITIFNNTHNYEYVHAAADAVQAARLTTPRSNPQHIKVTIFNLSIEKGQVRRKLYGNLNVPLPLERMTEADYASAIADIVKGLPESFRNYVTNEAWDRGHSDGYEAVVQIADDIAGNLNDAIHNYRTAIVAWINLNGWRSLTPKGLKEHGL